jgi:hypothetical protein
MRVPLPAATMMAEVMSDSLTAARIILNVQIGHGQQALRPHFILGNSARLSVIYICREYA